MTTNFGGVDVVPRITKKLVFAIWGLCWYNFHVVEGGQSHCVADCQILLTQDFRSFIWILLIDIDCLIKFDVLYTNVKAIKPDMNM